MFMIIAIAALLLVILIWYFMSGSSSSDIVAANDPWIGTWIGRFGGNDRATITNNGGYQLVHVNEGTARHPVISGNTIREFGETGTLNGNQITWSNGNVWTKQ